MSQSDKFERAFWKLVLAASNEDQIPAWSLDRWETKPAIRIPKWVTDICDELEIEIPSTVKKIKRKISDE